MVTFPSQLPRGRGSPNINTLVISAGDLRHRAHELLSYSISDSTKKLYNTALNVFNDFRKHYFDTEEWPPHYNQLVDFVSYLSYKQYSPNTVKSYISGISYFCKLYNLSDPTQSFLLRKTLVGLGRKNVQVDERKPVTLTILSSILKLLPTICKSHYETMLFSTIFSTAFFGYFRMGELVQNSMHDPGHAIQAGDVTYHKQTNKVLIVLKHSKTDQEGRGATISVTATLQAVCPVRLVLSFMQLRPSIPSAFFGHISGSPVTRYQVSAVFNMALDKLGLSKQTYKTHSFRIGAASTAWANGASEKDIAGKGRWKSQCLYKCIRN